LISVVISVYNRAEELRRALNGVLHQTLRNFEVLVVDDCSEVDIENLVITPMCDSRIRYHRLDKKGNANVCRNLGIKEAKGKYIAMLDSDDEWLPQHLERKLKYIEESVADGVFGSLRVVHASGERDELSPPFKKGEKMINYLLSNEYGAQTSTHFYKTECARAIMWDETLRRHQDWDFCVRFFRQFSFVPSNDITCLVHVGHQRRRADQFESLIRFIAAHRADILPELYCQYHKAIYQSIHQCDDIPLNYKNHYKREMLRYMDVINLRDYLSVFSVGKGRMGRLWLRLEFVLRVLFKS